jgi:hypothetical protein
VRIHALVEEGGAIVALAGPQPVAAVGGAPRFAIVPQLGQISHPLDVPVEMEAIPLRDIARDYRVEIANGKPHLVRSAP